MYVSVFNLNSKNDKNVQIALSLRTLNLTWKLSECLRRYEKIPRGWQQTTMIKVVMSSFTRRRKK